MMIMMMMRAHNRHLAFENQQFELVWISLTSVPSLPPPGPAPPKSNSFNTNIIFASLLLHLLWGGSYKEYCLQVSIFEAKHILRLSISVFLFAVFPKYIAVF
jgi:hypothetical protein